MGFAEKYNKFNTIFDIDIKDFEFMDGYDFIAKYGDNVVKIDGLYINKKGNYNDHPVAIITAEKILLDFEFENLDSLVGLHTFDDVYLFGYAIKLKLLERQSCFVQSKGQTEFKRLSEQVQQRIYNL